MSDSRKRSPNYWKNWYEKHGEKKRQYERDTYEAKKALGLCTRSGCKEEARPFRVTCDNHR